LANNFNITLTTSKNPNPGTEGVNFAESGARIDVGPTPPATQPRSLTQQVAEFQNYVASSSVAFNPNTTLFFLSGGLNDHTMITSAQANAATMAQVTTLSIRLALVCSRSPCFRRSFLPSATAPTISILALEP
jgi:cholinesterase